MANRRMKRSSMPLVIREMQIKTTMSIISHLSESLSSVNQQATSTGRMWRKRNPFALLVGMQIGTATVESSMEVPQKIKSGSAF